ncbi:hypothetical protein BTVI_107529 [Pitangus sulphuratus]|nr:hypothetical protein BTVI_107529 [Pitangus sulphuratus]
MEIFYGQVELAPWSKALVLLVYFHHPDIFWRDNTARHTQSRKFLQITEDNFLIQVVEEPTRKGVLLDLLLTNQEGLVEDVKVGGSLDCSDHEMVELRILHGGSKAVSRTRALNFQRANFDLFKDLLIGIPWVKALEDKGIQESWSIFKYHFHQAQNQCITMTKKSGKGGRRPVWMSRELLANLKQKKEIYGMWKMGQATWIDYRNIIRVCSVAPIFKKGKKEDLGNNQPVSLTSILRKVMKQIILEVITKHVEIKKAISSQIHPGENHA